MAVRLAGVSPCDGLGRGSGGNGRSGPRSGWHAGASPRERQGRRSRSGRSRAGSSRGRGGGSGRSLGGMAGTRCGRSGPRNERHAGASPRKRRGGLAGDGSSRRTVAARARLDAASRAAWRSGMMSRPGVSGGVAGCGDRRRRRRWDCWFNRTRYFYLSVDGHFIADSGCGEPSDEGGLRPPRRVPWRLGGHQGSHTCLRRWGDVSSLLAEGEAACGAGGYPAALHTLAQYLFWR